MVSTRSVKRGIIEIYPKFIIKNPSQDLMIRGGDFYAVWLEDRGLWSTSEQDVIHLVDRELDRYFEEHRDRFMDCTVIIKHMWDAESGVIDSWHKYCQKQMRDSFVPLDKKLVFANSAIRKTDYATKRLPYNLEAGDMPAYNRIMSVLYSEEERHKIEWAIGAVVSGGSKTLQKFMVLYGPPGTGKSTVLNIIQQLFDGYYAAFDAKTLGSSSAFALEAFKTNPLVAIQHEGKLSKIEDNTVLNSLVSHEKMTVNNKYEKLYSTNFNSFLFIGTNEPVRITDAKSGLIRRLIDVSPTGNKVPVEEYDSLVKQMEFESGAIAHHCQEVYLSDPNYYSNYIPVSMLGASNEFYNFVEDSFLVFKREDGVSLKAAWQMYKLYCDESNVAFPLSKMKFKEELKNYFREYIDREQLEDGTRVRNYYRGFKTDKFEQAEKPETPKTEKTSWLIFKKQESLLDTVCQDCVAQYATEEGSPEKKWEKVKTKLKDLVTSRLHYMLMPGIHIVIDFDIPDENGEKSLEKNIEAASKFPPTYAELSKSGKGIHLHYIYNGDVTALSRVYDEHIEIKVFTGKSALRRMLTLCNDIPIATISSGLPLKKGDKMVNFEAIKSEKQLRYMIMKNLNKEYHPSTKPSIDFIFKILEDAYADGLHYDVSDMRNGVLAFAAGSSHQSDYCIKLVNKMKFKSEEISDPGESKEAPIVFYDVEVFPNLFLVNYKIQGAGKPVVRMINPKPVEIEQLMQFRLVGFNCRRYDNHVLYARMMGYDNEMLYNLSQKIINKGQGFFGEAYNVSYTDVYDFAAKKQSLKKWEIELGIHHQELGLPWDQPVPEELWTKVAEYCDNDVIATETVFNHLQGDFVARKILAILADKTVNDTTNQLTTRIIFGNDRNPQSQFNYRNMGEMPKGEAVYSYDFETKKFREYKEGDHTVFDEKMRPIFPGYKYENGVSTYRGEEVGEGGYVYAEKGIHVLVPVDDIASMHPSSIEAEQLFGEYTTNFSAIKLIRVKIKHGEFEAAKGNLMVLLINLYGEDKARSIISELTEYLTEEYADALAYALKIAINSVYGLTSAKFENPFKDPRNIDNIVAKRGALFMINLKHEVQKRGFQVAHIKTDSIKIPNATPEILQFVEEYGKLYGYSFEHESTYEKMCLVNDAVYVAQYATPEHCQELYGYVPADNKKHFKKHNHPWTATGAQFQVPYVFKYLFSKENILFEDKCETKSVSSSLYLDMNEDLPDVSAYEKELDKLETKYRKGEVSDTTFEPKGLELSEKIAEGHKYVFIGRVGSFCPIKPGCGGGLLCREQNGNYNAAGGTKGYRWLEAEMVKQLGKEKDIDESYYISLVDEAHDTIAQYGDFEWFVSTEPVSNGFFNFMNIPDTDEEEIPFN